MKTSTNSHSMYGKEYVVSERVVGDMRKEVHATFEVRRTLLFLRIYPTADAKMMTIILSKGDRQGRRMSIKAPNLKKFWKTYLQGQQIEKVVLGRNTICNLENLIKEGIWADVKAQRLYYMDDWGISVNVITRLKSRVKWENDQAGYAVIGNTLVLNGTDL